MKCNACGKSITDEHGNTTAAKMITVEYNEPKMIGAAKPMSKKFLQKQLGRYKLNKTYFICWECWLKSLGIKASKSKEAV